jgi:phage FluMu gp28-like protein
VQIEACMAEGIPVHVLRKDDGFKNLSAAERKKAVEDWCQTHLQPVLKALDPNLDHFMGEDFARTGDATDIIILEKGKDLRLRTKLIVELRNIPFVQQWEVLQWLLDRVPRFRKGAMDRGGNGAYLAEQAALKYGARIEEVSFSREWYELQMPPYIEAFSDKTILLPKHEDVVRDHQALQYVDGIIRVPKDFRFQGTDGLYRHGDSAIAGALAWYAANSELHEFGYTPVPAPGRADDDTPDTRPWWASPLGAGLRGSAF